MKVLVAYDTKYGNTQRVAELIVEGLKEDGAEDLAESMKEVDYNEVLGIDVNLWVRPIIWTVQLEHSKKLADKL